jgi:PAS domain S-box-containing protein
VKERPDTNERPDADRLARENAELRARLDEAEDTLRALRGGEVDAIVIGDDVYTLESTALAANRLRSDVLAQMDDAVVVVDLDGHVIYLNPAAERQYGVPLSQVLGRPRDELFRVEWLEPSDETTAREALETEGFWRGRNRHARRNGSPLLVETTLSRLRGSDGDATGTLAVARDVSGYAAAEAELRENRAVLRFALESARAGEWEFDFGTRRVEGSARHDLCFGYVERKAWWDYDTYVAHLHAEDRRHVQRLFADVGAGAADELHFEARVIWPDGSEHWIESHAGVFETTGQPRRLVGVVGDVTERKNAEAALRDAARRKDEFLATLAHELRNPLAPIRNSVQIMRLSRERAVQEKAQSVIERQLEHMVHLIDDLLDVSRISQGKILLRRQLVDIAAVVQSALDTTQPLIDSSRHELVVRLPSQAALIDADMTRMTQVLSNLLNNAVKYTPDGGRIALEADAAGGFVTVTVTDSGIGIPHTMLPRVFEMFTQIEGVPERAQGGLGIGLALVKQLVEMHGGTVEARSAGVGLGSTFVVRLPAASAPSPRVESDAAATPQPLDAQAGWTVLVVDDNRDSADTLVTTLQLIGYRPSAAYDGEEAVERAETTRPRVVLLDIGLPRIDGYETARRIRAKPWGRDVVLVAMTGWGQEEDRRRTRSAGFDEHLVKPVPLERLTKLFARLRGVG